MPLKLYKRGGKWWVDGRLDGVDGRVRRSLGTSDKAIAEIKVSQIERDARERAILGDRAPKLSEKLTFAGAIMLYEAKPADAEYLKKVVPHLGNKRLIDITGAEVRKLCASLYPKASTDTWQRQVLTPVRAVINNAHEFGKGPAIRIRGFNKQERQDQDKARGRLSRIEKKPGSWPWLIAFRSEAPPYLRALALFMFTTGARISQSLEISPKNLDLQKSRVWLPAAKGHPAQWIAITQEMVVELANLPPRHDRVFGYKARWSVYGAWKKTCRRAGIEIIMPHAAGRHGFGTEMVARHGLDPVTVAKVGRWSDASLLLKTYVHPDDAEAAIRDALGTGRAQSENTNSLKILKGKEK